MLIAEYYNRLDALERIYSGFEDKGIGNVGLEYFNVLKCSLVRYTILLEYILKDVNESNHDPLPISGHSCLDVVLRGDNIGYIEIAENPIYPEVNSFSDKQIREFNRQALRICYLVKKLLTNSNIIDYVGQSKGKFDYDSIISLLLSIEHFLTDLMQVVEFNNLRSNFRFS